MSIGLREKRIATSCFDGPGVGWGWGWGVGVVKNEYVDELGGHGPNDDQIM